MSITVIDLELVGPLSADAEMVQAIVGAKGDAGTTTWAGIDDKPPVIAAGDDAAEARAAIGAVADDDPRLSDARPPTAHQHAIGDVTGLSAALAGKVDKVAGKGLSTEDYTTAEKSKLSGIAAGATANATDAQLRDRSTHTGAQAISTVTGLQAALDAKQPAGSYEPTLAAGTAGQYLRGDKTWQALNKAAVGLGNVDNVGAAALRDRATHTGVQAISTVTGLRDELDDNHLLTWIGL